MFDPVPGAAANNLGNQAHYGEDEERRKRMAMGTGIGPGTPVPVGPNVPVPVPGAGAVPPGGAPGTSDGIAHGLPPQPPPGAMHNVSIEEQIRHIHQKAKQ